MSRDLLQGLVFFKSCHGLYCQHLSTTCMRGISAETLCLQQVLGRQLRALGGCDLATVCDGPDSLRRRVHRFCATFVRLRKGHSAKLFGGSSSQCLSSRPSFRCTKRKNWENCGMRTLSDLSGQDPFQTETFHKQLGSPEAPAPKASKACSLLERFARTSFIG